MRLQPAQVSDFRGGLNTGAPLTRFPSSQFPFGINADATVDGRLRRRLGTRRTHSTRLTGSAGEEPSSVSAATAWWPAGGAQRVAIAHDQVHYSDDDGTTWSLGQSGVEPSDRWQFGTVEVAGANWLYAAPGLGNPVFRWDGSSVWEAAPGVPSSPSSPSAQYMAVFGDRLYVAGHDGPRVYASAVGAPENFTTPAGLVLPVYPGTGPTTVRGLKEVGSVLLVFHRDATSYIDGYGQSDLIVAAGATGMSNSVGLLTIGTFQSVGDGKAIWLSGRGFEYYSGDRITPISSPQLDGLLNEEALQWIESESGDSWVNTSLFLADAQQYWCTLHIRLNRYILVKYDLRTKGWTVHEYGHRDELGLVPIVGAPVGALVAGPLSDVLGLTSQVRTRPEAFGFDGFYRDIDVGDVDDADSDGSLGLPIEMEAELRPFIQQDIHHKKRARQIRVSAETLQPIATIEVAAISDGLPAGGPNTLANPGFEAGLASWDLVDGDGNWLIGTLPRSGSNALLFDPLGGPSGAIATARSSNVESSSGSSGITGASALASVINLLMPWSLTLPAPDGLIDAADLMHLAHAYSGTLDSPDDPPDVVAGDAWEFSVWVRPEASGQVVRVGVLFLDIIDAIISSRYTPFDVFGRDVAYNRIKVWGRVPSGAVKVQGSIEVLPSLTGTVRFDDARLRRLRRHKVLITTGENDMPRQPRRAGVNGRGRVQQVGVYTTDRVEIVAAEERAETLRER